MKNLKYDFQSLEILKFVSTLGKRYLFGVSLSILFAALSVSLNVVHATHSDCTNWENKPDKDCDGIADQWEDAKQYTKTVNGNTVNVPLPAGVSKNHRDILIEIDYMVPHQPPASVIDSVAAKFNAMELLNPDTTYGINIHYVLDESVPHRDCIDVFSDISPDPDIDSFGEYKQNFMGNQSDRTSNADYYLAKRDVYHYALFIHTRCGSLSNQQSSGTAEQPGNDMVVSLGYPGWGNVIMDGNGVAHDTGSDEYKASTFMHELGHNLGLKHGGSADLPHCKPNYLSVMNYEFQFPNIVPGRPMDYSHSVVPSLKESALSEPNGIGPSSPTGLTTAVGHNQPPNTHSGKPHTKSLTANNSPINYDWLTDNDSNEASVQSSINNFHFYPCDDNDLSNTAYGGKLFGYDDIHYNSLVFWSTGGVFQNGTRIPTSLSVEPIPELAAVIPPVVAQFTSKPSLTNESVGNMTNISNSQSRLHPIGPPDDILRDSKLPPCDMDVPGCLDSPCERQDRYCAPIRGHNFSDPDARNIDVGNRTEKVELTLSGVIKPISDKVLYIDEYIQNLSDTKFVPGTNPQEFKKKLHESLVTNTDSAYGLINSTNIDDALGKIHKLRSLVDNTRGQGLERIKPPYNIPILEKVDELTIALEKMK